MSNAAENPSNFPTMIIPKGTEIRINNEGQLSIKTPGNLVIQNSGNYSELESTNGSIRIEENVNVEAVKVHAGQACFIQGTLTAWKVRAKKIALEDRARAYIMLQESEQLELSKTSRLVGNFANEKEVYLLLGKFNRQLKSLPASVGVDLDDRGERGMQHQELGVGDAETGKILAGPLQDALRLIEQEIEKDQLDTPSREALREVVFALHEKNLQRANLVYRDAFSELTVPSEALRKAFDILDSWFSRHPA